MLHLVTVASCLAGFPFRNIFGGAGDKYCPGSPATMHASCKVTALLDGTSCDAVKEEMLARVNGQYGRWHDPHNNGTYKVLDDSQEGHITFSRRTGDDRYTDHLQFTFKPGQGLVSGCIVHGCSESQVSSVADFSTNYCNMRMLYCGARDGCSPINSAWPSSPTEKEVKPSVGASSDKNACFKS
jgi:hypothetical protein